MSDLLIKFAHQKKKLFSYQKQEVYIYFFFLLLMIINF